MGNQGRKTPRLVADRRYGKSAKTAAKGRAKTAARKPAKTARTRRKGGGGSGGGRGPVAWIKRLFRWVLRLIWVVTWRVTAVVLLVTALAVAYVYAGLPDVRALLDGRARGSVTMLDREGDVFAWRGDQFGGVVTADTVSPELRNAVLATEDKRFYRHFGLSPRGIASAVRINLSEGRGPLSGHGGSTITQQTAKLLCLGVEYDESEWESEAEYVQDCRRGSLSRKAKEAIYAMAMEAKYSKNEILSIYLNRAYFGGGAFGVEGAAQRYFGVSAREVNAAQAAMLAGLLTAPTRLAPTTNLERSQARAATVLRLMNEQGYLTDAETQAAQDNPATLSEAAEAQAGGYFADWVMDSGPELFTRDTTEDVIIQTTLDQRMQRAAEEALTHVFENKVSEGSKAQAAIVVMSADGAVRAMVGGRKSRVTGAFNRATMAKRQTGSAFKPFVYATALELGYEPNSMVVDEPYCLDIAGSGRWCPDNYDNRFHGRVPLITALAKSYNIPAVKVSESVGRDLVRRVASDFGIDNELADGPALALGASESTLLEMTGAYAGILNGGSSVTPYGLVELKLLGDDDPLMRKGGGIGERVIQQEAAQKLMGMMYEVVQSGTGTRAKLPDRQAAGKTGTTQAARDAWFLGFTADYVTGVWMGYDDNTPLKGVTGGGLPADIWRETMVRVNEGVPVNDLPMIRVEPQPQVQQQPRTQTQQRQDRDRGNTINRMLEELLGPADGGR
ncbi:Penicillin-binding protein 2D [Roseovarius sp. THAF9]|uniref:transglycosylase domain-containing protein n=1 Tax=Roseovarius sp. THAF9 TaxID=2587847 RepID=UPI0012698464|nr:transglycosylase domain-containing protein [Roseovarius sp. THAF9]QFT94672.1 Penicillin-binding protein 2D [Roseovarius sp. THAF9]